jgi:hypothetical protein
MRIILIISGVVFALLLGAGGVGYIWWRVNGEELVEAGQQAMEEGRAFGETGDKAGCVAVALERVADCEGFSCELSVQVFLTGCLASSQATPGFCAGVPRRREILGTVRWRAGVCDAVQLPADGSCGRLLGPVQEFCFPDS